MVSCAYAQKEGEQETITVTGTLARVFAIGGETTGWAVKLDSPLEVEGKKLGRIEVDAGSNSEKISELEDKHVRVTGTLEKRHGVERGEYWVIAAKEIEEIKS
jgi:predicted metalloprotease